jgi:SAM-dependent methyltransferase
LNQNESTKEFLAFISGNLTESRQVVDLGCGAGATTSYIASKFSGVSFIGIDLDSSLIDLAKKQNPKVTASNVDFHVGNLFEVEDKGLVKLFHESRSDRDKVKENDNQEIDGVISLATLSWLDNFEEPIKQIVENIGPQWIGLSSLFYEGEISCVIKVIEHERQKESNYNVYSLKNLDRFVSQFGYKITRYNVFDIGIDLPTPPHKDLMQTYTEKILSENAEIRRIQISGPLLMNWYFVLIERAKGPILRNVAQ